MMCTFCSNSRGVGFWRSSPMAKLPDSTLTLPFTKPVLCVGNAVCDLINVVEKFPVEDSEQHGTKYYWQRGGNATNNCTVLSLLGTQCEFMGVLATSGPESRWLQEDYQRSGIAIHHCVTTPGQCPIATSIINTESGSRTIIAYLRKCPELKHVEFDEKLKGDFSPYSWVHFELRKETKEVAAMMNDIRTYNDSLQDEEIEPVTVSVEVENPGIPHPELAMALADFVFISKDFAKSRGYTDIEQTLRALYVHCKPGSVLVCAWGDHGAGTKYKDQIFMSPATKNIKVVDSLGAGDTFVAGFINAILKNSSLTTGLKSNLQKALDFSCQLAGYKCSIFGYEGLKDFELNV